MKEPKSKVSQQTPRDSSNSETNGKSLRWIAYELHDGLLPWLQSASMLLKELPLEAEAVSRHQTGLKMLQHAMDEARQLMGFVESAAPDQELSLPVALHAMISRLEPMALENHQEISVIGSIGETKIERPDHIWNITRILQQALVNAIQHAGPVSIQLRIEAETTGLLLEVLDRGCGFDLDHVDQRNHFGIVSMRHRARAIGAGLEVISHPGEGTSVRLRVPWT